MMRLLALAMGVIASLRAAFGDIDVAQIDALLAITAAVLSLRDGWVGRMWHRSLDEAERERQSKIEL